MSLSPSASAPAARLVACLTGLLVLAGCAAGSGPGSYNWFGEPDPSDPWSLSILRRQMRAREETGAEPNALSSVVGHVASASPAPQAPGSEHLRERYLAFVVERKLALLREVAAWAQTQASHYYVSDQGVDDWPTLEEILARNGDDCDGLELLTYYFLRDLGFEHVYRAVVVRRRDDQHHMVTLWFETPDDPRVIDPTGAMTSGAPRMSELRGWVPLKVFSETREFTVRRRSSR